MRKLLAAVTVLVTVSATGASGIAGADEPAPVPAPGAGSAAPEPQRGTPGNAYALGGAHVLGIPYDEYIRRTGADWFPGLNRMNIQYPAGQVQGHTLERLFPGIGKLDDGFPGLGLDGPSIGESVDVGEGNLIHAIQTGGSGTAMGLSEGAMVLNAVKNRLATDPAAPPPDQLSFATFGDPLTTNPFGQSFLRQNFPVGSVVPSLDFTMPPEVDSQYDTYQFISPYDSIADWPQRQDNIISVTNAIVGLATGHTAVAFTNPSNVPPQNVAVTYNSRGAKTTTYMIPEQHLPLVLPFKYIGVDEGTLNKLDGVLKPYVDAGYTRNDNPLTAPITVDPVRGYDPAVVTAGASEAAFGSGGVDPLSQLMAGFQYVLDHNVH